MAAPTKGLRAIFYARISSDRDGEGLGVDRQVADCEALCERNGWTVVDSLVENDTSASTKSRKPRPLYEHMLRRARNGEADAIVAYSNSRLTRRPREFEDLIDLADRHGVRIVTVVSGEDNLATADGRMVARIKASVDAAEAERTSERARRAKSQAVQRGEYRGGPRPYGFEADGATVRESEAEVIREATTAVLAGRSLTAVARDLTKAGHRTARGKEWTYDRLRDVLLRPRNAALVGVGRTGREGFDPETSVHGAAWEPIVPEEQWRALYALVMDPARRTQDGNASRWLGSGTYRCGHCGAPLRAAPHSSPEQRAKFERAFAALPTKQQTDEGRKRLRREMDWPYHYRCPEYAHLTIETTRTDRFVAEAVAELLRDPRVVAAMTEPDPRLESDRAQRLVLVSRLDRFDADYEAGLIDGAKHKRFSEKASAELAEVDARIASAVQRSTSSEVLSALDPGAAFLAAPVDVQRAVVRSILVVTIGPASRRGVPWSSERIRLSRPEEAATP